MAVFSVCLTCAAAWAQNSPPRHVLHDWSSRHVVFTGLTPDNVRERTEADPRAWHSWLAHARHRFAPPARPRHFSSDPRHRRRHRDQKLAIAWQVPLLGVGPWSFPAKFGFDVNATPDCANDFVVFPTSMPGVTGASGSATLVAFNNLYTGPGPSGICPTPLAPQTQPSVLFAYNTATTLSGESNLSPVLSLDGKKVAFLESNDGAGDTYAAFHVLTWVAGEGGLTSAALPGNCAPGNSCMTTLVLSNVTADRRSSPFVDYAHDTAYVGDTRGLLHKITQVFLGTPAEIRGNGWPVQLSGTVPRSPVLDSVSGRIFVASNGVGVNGSLDVVDSSSGTILATQSLPTFGLSDLIVDSTNQTVFVFFASYPSFSLSVAQFDTSGTLLRQVSGLALGGDANAYTGAFDNNYFTNPSTGSLYFAGAVNFFASLYRVGFTGRTMNAALSGPLVLTTGTLTSVPGPLTEIYNPALSSAPDRLFVGIYANCTSAGTDGCIESLDISQGFPAGILDFRSVSTGGASDSVSGIIVDNVDPSAQASSIYFETPFAAYKLTQSGLQ